MTGEKDLLLLISSQFYIQAHQADTLKLAIGRIYTMDISKGDKSDLWVFF